MIWHFKREIYFYDKHIYIYNIIKYHNGLTPHVETYKQRLLRRAPIIIVTCVKFDSAVKWTFGEENNKLYPDSIYPPPSYNANLLSTEG